MAGFRHGFRHGPFARKRETMIDVIPPIPTGPTRRRAPAALGYGPATDAEFIDLGGIDADTMPPGRFAEVQVRRARAADAGQRTKTQPDHGAAEEWRPSTGRALTNGMLSIGALAIAVMLALPAGALWFDDGERGISVATHDGLERSLDPIVTGAIDARDDDREAKGAIDKAADAKATEPAASTAAAGFRASVADGRVFVPSGGSSVVTLTTKTDDQTN